VWLWHDCQINKTYPISYRDVMMKKFVVAGVLAVSSMLASQWGMAATLEDDMRTLAIGYKTFAGSDNAQQATAALTKMRVAALDSKKQACQSTKRSTAVKSLLCRG
jgi:hypothetical protein